VASGGEARVAWRHGSSVSAATRETEKRNQRGIGVNNGGSISNHRRKSGHGVSKRKWRLSSISSNQRSAK